MTCVYRWVHLVCALYVPGVAFSNVDKLNGVTLFEMSYTKWGAKVRFTAAALCICVHVVCVVSKQCVGVSLNNSYDPVTLSVHFQ